MTGQWDFAILTSSESQTNWGWSILNRFVILPSAYSKRFAPVHGHCCQPLDGHYYSCYHSQTIHQYFSLTYLRINLTAKDVFLDHSNRIIIMSCIK